MRNLLILAAFAVFLTGCFRGKETESGPEDTLKTFYKELCAGNLDEAAGLCDSPGMDGYMEGYRIALVECDSTVSRLASDILSEMTVTITDMEKNGQDRTVFYKLAAPEGLSKEKVAILRKVEGAWKIEEITDIRFAWGRHRMQASGEHGAHDIGA